MMDRSRSIEGNKVGNPEDTRRIPSLVELLAQIMAESRCGETFWGPDLGKEIVEW
jgi:hypothetical protein